MVGPKTELVSYSDMRILLTAALLAPLALGACASKPGKVAEQNTRRGFDEATHAPLEDFNMVRSRIPRVLIEATADPYNRPEPVGCSGLSKELARLDDALGPDIDNPRASRTTGERASAFVSNAGARAMKDITEGWIPMRSWVRYMSGAEQHSRDVTQAISSGQVRRAYLKGLAQSEGCSDLGPAQPVYLFPAPPKTPSSVGSTPVATR